MKRFSRFDIWTTFRRYILPGLSLITGRSRFKIFEKNRENEWLPPNKVRELQLEKIGGVLKEAKMKVPYYREILADKDLSSVEKAFETFQSLPILTKTYIQQNHSRMISDESLKKPVKIGYTGGSTGEPLKILYDLMIHEEAQACFMRVFNWGGWKIGEPIAMFWGGLGDLPSKKSLMKTIKEKINGNYFFGTYHYNDQLMGEWIRFLSENQIHFIYGYASVLVNLARFIRRKGIRPPVIKAVFSTAETLFPNFRSDIEDVFQCKVFDQYGSREVIAIASQCEKGSMHILADMVYLEFLQRENPEGPKSLIATSFLNPIMPFIRYEIGDYGFKKEGSCPCGRGFPLMGMSIGRRNDHIELPEGGLIYPSYFIHLLDGLKGIQSFQFRQDDLGEIYLKIQKGPEWDNENQDILNHLEKKIQLDLNSKLQLNIQFVDEIQITPSGKHRYVISNVMKNFTPIA